jgi:hypothetical protein
MELGISLEQRLVQKPGYGSKVQATRDDQVLSTLATACVLRTGRDRKSLGCMDVLVVVNVIFLERVTDLVS